MNLFISLEITYVIVDSTDDTKRAAVTVEVDIASRRRAIKRIDEMHRCRPFSGARFSERICPRCYRCHVGRTSISKNLLSECDSGRRYKVLGDETKIESDWPTAVVEASRVAYAIVSCANSPQAWTAGRANTESARTFETDGMVYSD